MICEKCGAVLDEDAYFCGMCGNIVQSKKKEEPNPSEYENVNADDTAIGTDAGEDIPNAELPPQGVPCRSCGAINPRGTIFCPKCGRPVNEVPKGNTKRKYIVVIIVLSAVLLGCISCIGAYLFYNHFAAVDDTPNESDTAMTQTAEAPVPTLPPVVTKTPNPILSERRTLYSSAATYRRMPEIHNTVRSDDVTFEILADMISDFDECCEAYMNNGDTRVFEYLKPGTTAYEQQTDYKRNHPNLSQEYLDISTSDAREYNGYYYLWVSETLRVIENGSETVKTDNWVYKIRNTSDGWEIYDYTRDPVA